MPVLLPRMRVTRVYDRIVHGHLAAGEDLPDIDMHRDAICSLISKVEL